MLTIFLVWIVLSLLTTGLIMVDHYYHSDKPYTMFQFIKHIILCIFLWWLVLFYYIFELFEDSLTKFGRIVLFKGKK